MSSAQKPRISDKDFILIMVSTFLGATASVVLQDFLKNANCVATPPPTWLPMQYCGYYADVIVLLVFACFCLFAPLIVFAVLAALRVIHW
jgi:hypothetical protein